MKAASYTVVPRGRYPGYVDSVEYGPSNSTGAPMLTWILKFEYDDEDEEGEAKERTLRFYTTLRGDGLPRSKATIERLIEALTAAGEIEEFDFATFNPNEADELFGGMEVDIVVTVRPDRDDRKIKRNNVADIYPLESE